MIKRNILKTVVILFTILFLFATFADMYLKTYGDISQFSATERVIEDTEKLATTFKKSADCIRLMSYNILSDSLPYEGTDSAQRADGVCRIIESISPDVAGLQETSRKWFACIYNNTDYRFFHPVRTSLFETMTTIIYNTDTVALITGGVEAYKNGGDSRLRRMVWAVFKTKATNKVFIVVNTHFDLNDSEKTPNDNTIPMTQALELISLCKNLKELFRCPVFPIGDFNAKESTKKKASPVYDLLCTTFSDTKNLAKSISYGDTSKRNAPANDHIFLLGEAYVASYCTLSQNSFKPLSDHCPIFADFIL